MINIQEELIALLRGAGVVDFGDDLGNFNFVDDANLDSFEIINIISDMESIIGAELPIEQLEKPYSRTILGFVKVAETVIGRGNGGNL